MEVDLSKYTKLTKDQVGHLRHFHNLASQRDGEWNHMGTQEPMQEFLDAYRYQLATMAYATALTHYHRQPVLRGLYKPLLRRLIHKMLRREVWAYWFSTSLGGTATDPSLTELRKPWADPIVKENIMYSGHLLLMTSLYAMLFDDDEFERDESLVFHWNPLFYGLGPETFSYKNQTLQKAVLEQMESNGWVGVCCEPNAVFIVCNQFPIIAIRLNDVRHGTNVTEAVLPKYRAAWEQKGMTGPGGLLKTMWLVKQNITILASDPGSSAWTSAFMNSWNSEFVRASYDSQALGYLTTIDGETRLQIPAVGNAYRKLVTEGGDSGARPSELLRKALEIGKVDHAEKMGAKSFDKPLSLFSSPLFGYVAKWLSELGRPELKGLLKFADDNLNPTWENGGLYYPRNDEPVDEKLQWTHMDPFTGNAAIGYARLNIEDGIKKMYEKPWTQADTKSHPWVDGISLADDIDFLRGVWDVEKGVLVLTVNSWNGSKKTVKPIFKNLDQGKWHVFVDGCLKISEEVKQGGEIVMEIEVGMADVDVVAVIMP